MIQVNLKPDGIYLKNTNKSKCPFVHYKTKVGMIYLPIAHGEGKFITKIIKY